MHPFRSPSGRPATARHPFRPFRSVPLLPRFLQSHLFPLFRMAALVLLAVLCLGRPAAAVDATLPKPASLPWSEVEAAARGTTVRFHMYGGMATANRYVDGFVAPELARRYGITLVRVPMEAPVFVNRLLAEKSAGRATGSMDLLWINGENFRNARLGGVLWGPYAPALPNMALTDPVQSSTDFGYPVDGYESPYGRAQLVLEYDTARIPEPPRTMAQLGEWVKAHPGRFTYPQPPDFTGSAFIRQAFYALTGGHAQYMRPLDKDLLGRKAPVLWGWLRDLAPHLWQAGRAYPRDAAALDALFARGEVDFSVSYHPAHAQALIDDGTYPATVRTVVLDDGSIFNTHFVAIPFNAPNKAGAMVVANFLLSPEAQLAKMDPAWWGDFPAIEVGRLPEEWRARFAAMKMGEATLSPDVLAKRAVPEIPADWLEALERGWDAEVLRR
ncbi:ABC transporter substrate-binding protein [Nitratidesulfovibrio termitidis]|uniref:ABC transporter substrate-binding protein n=1 Tax=Nitratidesulfovibrio termitidis TaxID=42252 RepID=UPI00040015B8|nr:ABC transporter substrate-binding protein [Nitratidesulfovibrio termitidis]